MQIICKSGTTIQCEDFEAIDSGVLFYQQTPGRQRASEASEEEEEEEEEYEAERASGFVPLAEVQFVLPDAMVQQPPQGGMEQQRGQVPPQSQQGGMAQQQQMQQFPGGPSQGTR